MVEDIHRLVVFYFLVHSGRNNFAVNDCSVSLGLDGEHRRRSIDTLRYCFQYELRQLAGAFGRVRLRYLLALWNADMGRGGD